MKDVRGLLGIFCLGLTLTMTSCLDSSVEDPNKQLNADIAAIESYLIANNITTIKDPSGMRMEIIELGTKLPARSINTTVDVDYVGKLFTDGSIFDQGNIKLPLSNLIDGWKIAFTTLPVGSRAKLYIPSPFGYGGVAKPGIPPNSILVFDVEFIEAVITTTELQKLDTDTVAIDNYLAGKPNVTKDTTGIRYVITNAGSGALATWYDQLTVKLTYKLLTDDSKIVATVDQFPSNYFYSRPVDYVNGLKVGLQKMKKGGKATFYIPSGLGFGPTGAKDGTGAVVIPANSNLIVDVEITDIQ